LEQKQANSFDECEDCYGLYIFIDYAKAANKHTDIQNVIKAVNIKRQH